jgi:hypothetical protein
MTLRRTWRLGLAEIALRKDLLKEEVSHPFRGLGEDRLRDPFARKLLIEMYQALRGGGVPGDLSNPTIARQVFRVIHEAFERGDLISVRRKAESGVGTDGNGGPGIGPGSGSSTGNKKSNQTPPADPVSEKTWVDVKLVDEDGEPVAGARYKLKITDGSTREGTLDSSGRVRVANIDPGTCQVWFPDYDGSEWSRLS